jgi:hypothetical protein
MRRGLDDLDEIRGQHAVGARPRRQPDTDAFTRNREGHRDHAPADPPTPSPATSSDSISTSTCPATDEVDALARPEPRA